MEWLSRWFDRIVQSAVWHSVLSHFQWLDWLVLVLVVIGIFYGMKKGFMIVMGEILQLIVIITLTLEFDGKVDSLLNTYAAFLPADIVPSTGFIITAVLLWLAVGFVATHLGKIISAQTSSFLRIFGGAVGGGFYLFLFLSFISQAVILSPFPSLKTVYERNASCTGFILARMAPKIHNLATRPFGFAQHSLAQ